MTTAQGLVVLWSLLVLTSDLTARRIPNFLSIGAALFAAIFLVVSGMTVLGANWQAALVGMALGLLLTLPAYLARWLGAGDVKLVVAIGLLDGWQGVVASFAVAGLLAGMVAVAWMTLERYGGSPMPTTRRWLPFGAALAVGMLVKIGLEL